MNNKGADQPAHPRRLISAFVIRFFEITIFKLTTSGNAIFKLVSVAKELCLNLTLSETPKTRFCRDGAQLYSCCCVAVCVLCLFLAVPWVGLWSVSVAFPGHTPVLPKNWTIPMKLVLGISLAKIVDHKTIS